jgi:hypothetical protein
MTIRKEESRLTLGKYLTTVKRWLAGRSAGKAPSKSRRGRPAKARLWAD